MNKKFFISICALSLAVIGFFFLPRAPLSKNEIIFHVSGGEGAWTIAKNLEKEGLISWSPYFRAYVFFSEIQSQLQAGYYSLSPSMQIFQIASKIARGDVMKVGITIFEGSDSKDVHLYTNVPVENEKLADYRANFDFLADAPSETAGLEGYLFPDTYYFNYGDTSKEVAEKMLANFDKKLSPELRTEIKRQKKSIFEIVTMASLLEKEVKTKEDMEIVSGLLWKRMEAGMPLQVDAATSTYLHLGLPQGPICNPGLNAIEAAVYPKGSPYWYYLSKPDGKTVFSKTLQEHNIAKNKYLD